MKVLLMILVLALPLSACGKKPGTLQAPEDAKTTNTTYPRTYPTK